MDDMKSSHTACPFSDTSPGMPGGPGLPCTHHHHHHHHHRRRRRRRRCRCRRRCYRYH
jgi:hypothetical protein